MINENLDDLSPLLRTAFLLREVEGYSTVEAARKPGVTENTLKARLWRARHQLAERLGRRLRRMKDGMQGNGMADSLQLLLKLLRPSSAAVRNTGEGLPSMGDGEAFGLPLFFVTTVTLPWLPERYLPRGVPS